MTSTQSLPDVAVRLQTALGPAYTVQTELGGGGMSRVFAVRDHGLDRDIVVKLLPPELAGELSVERFKREIKFAASLQHPHIVPVHAAGDADGLPFYTMPRVEGESLRDRLARIQRLPVHEAIAILRDIARALAYAHKRGIVHRDIKPENVLVHEGMAVVTDFGIAKAIAAARHDEGEDVPAVDGPTGTGLTMTGISLGTPSYMAPEQAASDPRMDHRVDLYALGVVGYELLAGRTPFSGRTPREQLTAQLAERPRDLGEMRLDIPPRVSELVMRALEKDPDARPRSADDMVRELDAAIVGAPAAVSIEEPANIRRALVVYAATFLAATGLAWVAMREVGVPDWVLPGTIVVMALGLPVLLFTAISRYAAFRAAVGSSAQRSGSLVWQNPFGDRGLQVAQYLSWRRLATGGALALGGFGVLVAGFMASRASGIGPAATLLSRNQIGEHPRILVTDFGAAASDSALARLSSEAVRVGFEQSNVVRVLATSTLGEAMRRMRREPSERLTLDVAREVAAREGIAIIADGDLVRTGDRVLLTVRLLSADSGKTLATQSASAMSPDQLIAAAGQVTRRLRGSIGESLKLVRETTPLERVTTASRAALDQYALAMQIWHREGRQQDAIEPLKRAVEIDTLFVSAWRALAVVLGNLGLEPELRAKARARAFALRERTTENERLLIEGTYYTGVDLNRAIATYEQLWRRTGDPPVNLGIVLNARQQYARAESLYRAVARRGPFPQISYEDFIESLGGQGKLDAADSVARDGRSRFPEVLRLPTAFIACAREQFDVCEAMLDSVLTSPTSAPQKKNQARGALTTLADMRGNIARSYQLQRDARPPRQPGAPLQFGDVIDAADADMKLGRNDRALARLDSVASANLRPGQLLRAAWTYANAGRPDRGRIYLERWQREIGDTSTSDATLRQGHIARAWIAEAEGRWSDVIAEWKAFTTSPKDGRALGNCTTCVPQARARMYYAAARPDSAIYWYEHFLTVPEWPPVGRLGWYPETYERLSELYEKVGNKERAMEYSTKFLDLWKNADPALQPHVRAVRARLDRLR